MVRHGSNELVLQLLLVAPAHPRSVATASPARHVGFTQRLQRISGTAPKHINTKVAAQQAMREHVERILHPERAPKRKEVPSMVASGVSG